MQKLPKTINGIKTDKNATVQRREIVKNTYLELLEQLQRTKGKKSVYNDFLDVDVYVSMRESGKKAGNNSVKNWQLTYAVKNLEMIIKNAKPLPDVPIYTMPKTTGKQKEFNSVKLVALFYEFRKICIHEFYSEINIRDKK